MYFKVIEVARGIDPVNGTNGHIKELFSREEYTVNIKEDEQGNVNFKEMGVVKSIHRGEPIALITLPTAAVDGIQVTGEAVKGIDGKYPEVPIGINTALSEDRTKLISTIDGEIYFKNDKFNVRKLLTINQDIDSSIGNVDFAGDIVLNGFIREGFSVKCEGNMEIYGGAEAAEIKVGGNLFMSKGMSGGTTGSIDVGGNLSCTYLEHCNVKVKKNLHADQILNSNVFAEGEIIVTGGKGRIIGGDIFAGKRIRVSYLGNDYGTSAAINLTVGMACLYYEQQLKNVDDLEKIKINIMKLNQNISYLENLGDRKNDLQKKLLDKLKFQLNIRKMQKENVSKNIDKLDAKIKEKDESCEIKCDQLKPTVNLNFNTVVYTINQDIENVRIFRIGNQTIIRGKDFKKVIEN